MTGRIIDFNNYSITRLVLLTPTVMQRDNDDDPAIANVTGYGKEAKNGPSGLFVDTNRGTSE